MYTAYIVLANPTHDLHALKLKLYLVCVALTNVLVCIRGLHVHNCRALTDKSFAAPPWIICRWKSA